MCQQLFYYVFFHLASRKQQEAPQADRKQHIEKPRQRASLTYYQEINTKLATVLSFETLKPKNFASSGYFLK